MANNQYSRDRNQQLPLPRPSDPEYVNGQREWPRPSQNNEMYRQENQSVPTFRPQENRTMMYEEPKHGPPKHRQERPPGDRLYENTNAYYNSSSQHDQGRNQNRSYQYDERFQNRGYGRSQQPPGRRSMDGQWVRDRHKPSQPGPERERDKKAKPRERILTEPVSPTMMSWDNPFPTFNTKKRHDKSKHSSLEKDPGKTGHVDTRGGGSRPPTSDSDRRREGSIPHTSQGYEPGEERGEEQHFQRSRHLADYGRSSGPFSQPDSEMPLHKGPPDVRGGKMMEPTEGHQWQNQTRIGQMIHPPSMLDEATLAYRDRDPRRKPVVQRSATMPQAGGSKPDDFDKKESIPPNPYRQEGNWQTVSGGPSNEQLSRGSSREGMRRPNMPSSNSYEERRPSEMQYSASQRQYHSTSEFPLEQQSSFVGNFSDQNDYDPQNPEMPDFDAIPQSKNERFDDEIAGLSPVEHAPVYQKKLYQAPGSYQPKAEPVYARTGAEQSNQDLRSPTAKQPCAPGGETSSIANGTSATSGAPAHLSYGGRTKAYHEFHNQWGHTDSLVGASETEERQRPLQPPPDRFPPRNASRALEQGPSAGVARNYPNPDGSLDQRQYTEQDRHFADGAIQNSNSYANGYAEEYQQNTYAPLRETESRKYGYQAFSGEHCPPHGQSYPQAMSPALTPQSSRPSTEQPHDQWSRTAISKHPPPIRHYGERTSSDSMQRPNLQRVRTLSNGGPDTLPPHPVPIRPGLNQTADGPSQERRPNEAHLGANQDRRETGPGPANEGKQAPSRVTVQELNSLSQEFKSHPNDYRMGLKFAKKLVEASSVLANEGGRADSKTTAKNRERYIFDAHKVVKRLISAGYPEAMFYLADCHGQGLLGLQPDPKEAFSLYQSAAKLNHPQAAYRVAVCCEMGSDEGGGTRRDPLKAVQWYKRAATLGDTGAMYKMGMILLKGLLGQPRSAREALPWLKRAAERADEENPHALHELGLLYESASPNDNIIRDEAYSLQLFQKAANLKYKYSQFRLGSAYEHGMLGCPIDARQSIAWYSRAAAQGEHQAELALSGWYLTGSEPILQQSDTEAYLWARKAASSGLAKAEFAMGYYTEVGIGTAANMEEAKRWYYRAAAQNFAKARERLEELRKGGVKKEKTRVSRSAVEKQTDGECSVM